MQYQALCSVVFARGWRIKLRCDRDHVNAPTEGLQGQRHVPKNALQSLDVYDSSGELIARETLRKDQSLEHAAERMLTGLRKAGLVPSDG